MSDGILRKTGSYYVDEIGELQRQLTAAKAEIDSLWETLIKVSEYLEIDPGKARKIPGKPSQVFKAAILHKQADAVVPAIMRALTDMGNADLTYSGARIYAEDYAQRLRQQAEAAERGGGDDPA